jgi:hypothetical protein
MTLLIATRNAISRIDARDADICVDDNEIESRLSTLSEKTISRICRAVKQEHGGDMLDLREIRVSMFNASVLTR